MQLHQLKRPKNSRKSKRIVGRGPASGSGKTAGRGENGQRSRAGRWSPGSSEGGQMPLIRRLPKVGFTSKRPKLYQIVNVGQLEALDNNTHVTLEVLKMHKMISTVRKPCKILGDGELSKKLTVKIPLVSKNAKSKILAVGGVVDSKVDE
jgi:large subunit ribosomal protein L15